MSVSKSAAVPLRALLQECTLLPAGGVIHRYESPAALPFENLFVLSVELKFRSGQSQRLHKSVYIPEDTHTHNGCASEQLILANRWIHSLMPPAEGATCCRTSDEASGEVCSELASLLLNF